ncbi:MAG: ferredoxin [Actinomycetota bacterium]
MNYATNRNPLNAEGKFWIDRDVCLNCEVCIEEAPNNIKVDLQITGASYVFKQPENETEIQQLRNAISVCCVEAIIED